jgi:predicted transcriptional regulator
MPKPKEAVFTLKLEPDLRRAFMATARASDRTASQVVRDLMREYINRHQRMDEYAAFLSAKVERARAQAAGGRCTAAADVAARFASKRCLEVMYEPEQMRGEA